jgi:chromosome segregation ATPase
MSISAAERDELRELARDALGNRGADLLMAGLDAVDLQGLEERLTLRIELVRAELRNEMTELRAEVHREIAELRAEFTALEGKFAQLEGKFAQLEGRFAEMEGRVAQMEGRVLGEVGLLRGDIAAQVRVFYFAIVTTLIGLAGLAYTAFQAGQG